MTSPDPIATLLLTQRLLGLGLLLQSAEIFRARRIYASGGALAGGGVGLLLAVRSAISLWLILAPINGVSLPTAAIHLALLGSSAWLVVRSRGPVCGGSDSMFFQVQLGLFLASLGFLDPLLFRIGLGWIAAQSVLSYFLAGLAKLKNAGWYDGTALRNLFNSAGPYVLLSGVRGLANSKSLCALLGWGVVLFELAFPVVLVLPVEGKWVFLGLGLAFHLANAAVLGLNRFVWAWAAAYPALFYFQ
jgi:hypothetical protein